MVRIYWGQITSPSPPPPHPPLRRQGGGNNMSLYLCDFASPQQIPPVLFAIGVNGLLLSGLFSFICVSFDLNKMEMRQIFCSYKYSGYQLMWPILHILFFYNILFSSIYNFDNYNGAKFAILQSYIYVKQTKYNIAWKYINNYA